ncbi:MAG TPA: AI-2E family transporter [Selenomonadales bacterium]|nr:AI-2E family transporter [Selenomonadales bacterium]
MIVTRKTFRITLLAAAAAVVVYFLWMVRSGLYPFVLGFFLAYLLNPAVCWLEHRGIRRVWAIIILYIILFSVVIVGTSRLIPLLIRDLEGFARDLPLMTQRGEELLNAFQQRYQQSALPASLRIAVDNGLFALQTEIQAFISDVVGGIVGLIGKLVGLAISPILAFYLLHDWHQIGEECTRLLPAKWRHEFILIVRDVDKVLAGVIRGQLMIAIFVGILVSLGMYLLQVRYALLIGLLAGTLDIIPYFGAIIGATPAVTVALLDSPLLAAKVGLLFFVIHQAEGTVIGPKILGESTGLHPLSVIFFLFVGEELGGLPGMLLGVPVAAIIKVVLKHLIRWLV